MIEALMFLLGGIGRAYVGTGRECGPRWIGRWSVYPPIALLAAYVGLAPTLALSQEGLIEHLLVLWAALIASLSMGLGYTQWESARHMVLRFGLPSLVLVVPLVCIQGLSPNYLLYILLTVGAGLFYPHRQRVFELLRLDRLSYSWLDSSRLAEFVAGACILGGLSLL